MYADEQALLNTYRTSQAVGYEPPSASLYIKKVHSFRLSFLASYIIILIPRIVTSTLKMETVYSPKCWHPRGARTQKKIPIIVVKTRSLNVKCCYETNLLTSAAEMQVEQRLTLESTADSQRVLPCPKCLYLNYITRHRC